MKILYVLLFLLISFFAFSQTNKNTYNYSKLKAVFVFGHDDIVNFDYSEVKEIKKFLIQKGVKVKIFYDTSNKWDDIVKASKNANFFYYSGHGTYAGDKGSVGGLVLNEETVSSKKIQEELHLHKDAIVLFQSVCFSAGSSASDESDIGLKEAEKRISNYSLPFIKNGAAVYYASNSIGSMSKFFKLFFSGANVDSIYKNSLKYFYKNEVTKNYKYKAGYKLSIASRKSSGSMTKTSIVNGVKTVKKIQGFKSYEITLVSKPNFSIKDLFR